MSHQQIALAVVEMRFYITIFVFKVALRLMHMLLIMFVWRAQLSSAIHVQAPMFA